MGAVKRKQNLDQLLAILGNKDYASITKDHPNLVAPIDEFVATRNLEQPVTASAIEAVPAAIAVPNGVKK